MILKLVLSQVCHYLFIKSLHFVPDKPETNKTTVVIDKKIPLVSMSNHDKNVMHTKLTAKWAFILNYNDKLLLKKTTDKETCR